MEENHEEWIRKIVSLKMSYILDGKRYDIPHILREAIKEAIESAIRLTLIRVDDGASKK